MAQTIYASFDDASLAEKAAGALLDYGVRQEDLSLVAGKQYGQDRVAEGRTIDPAAVNRNFRGDWGSATTNVTQSAGDKIAQAGDRAAAAAAGAVGAGAAAANYNTAANQRAGQDTVDAGYRGGVAGAERTAGGATIYSGSAPVPVATGGIPAATGATTSTTDVDNATVAGMDTANRGYETAAKHGISTTSAADAESGAVKGAGWGLGLGILGLLASLAVPGVGWVVGGGALATAIAGAIGTTAAGAVVGGVTGYLKDQGVPSHIASGYQNCVECGGAVLAVTVPSGRVDAALAEQVMRKYGAAGVSNH